MAARDTSAGARSLLRRPRASSAAPRQRPVTQGAVAPHLARVAGQTVGQQRRRSLAAEVEPREADAVALQEHGTNRQRGSLH